MMIQQLYKETLIVLNETKDLKEGNHYFIPSISRISSYSRQNLKKVRRHKDKLLYVVGDESRALEVDEKVFLNLIENAKDRFNSHISLLRREYEASRGTEYEDKDKEVLLSGLKSQKRFLRFMNRMTSELKLA